MPSLELPDNLADLFAEDLLEELSDALGPDEDERADGRFEIEVEIEGQGTFCLRYRDGDLGGKKGFARGDPLISARIPKDADTFLLGLLQAALDEYPDAPALKSRQEDARKLKKKQLQAMVDGVGKLKEMGMELDVKGVGKFLFARGILDEVTRKVTASVDAKDVEATIAGAAPEQMAGKVKFGGNRGLLTEVVTALGPLWSLIDPNK
ncbi:MAG: hypothetical protein GY822_07295 [Deltaproteobacteria bacterium]|nr:hypothetical protein [Deltaproteobacteria bacterium]